MNQHEQHACPNCDNTARLQFLPMLDGSTIYAQCPCGYGWEILRPHLRWKN